MFELNRTSSKTRWTKRRINPRGIHEIRTAEEYLSSGACRCNLLSCGISRFSITMRSESVNRVTHNSRLFRIPDNYERGNVPRLISSFAKINPLQGEEGGRRGAGRAQCLHADAWDFKSSSPANSLRMHCSHFECLTSRCLIKTRNTSEPSAKFFFSFSLPFFLLDRTQASNPRNGRIFVRKRYSRGAG